MSTSLIVLGMHCSGGGMLANALEQCGAHVALREGLQALHEELSQESSAPVHIHIVRSPFDVAPALQASHGVDTAEGLALWEAYHANALRASKGHARVLVLYTDLMERPHQCLGELLCRLDALGVQKLALPGKQALNTLINSYQDRNSRSPDEDEVYLSTSQKELWRQLSNGLMDGEFDPHRLEREPLERALHNRVIQVAALKATTKEQATEIAILNQRLAWLDAQVRDLQASSSWRVTAPLRSVSTAFRKLRTKSAGSNVRQRQYPGGRSAAASTRVLPTMTPEDEDTFVLYRIIGNDLYPRHKHGQAVENLKFIIEHEPSFEACEKRFVVNRILDARQEKDIISLLDQAGFEYIRIPFEPEEYARISFDTAILPEPGFLINEQFEELGDDEKSRLLSALYRHKNNYVMNNNGARNVALEEGRSRGRWILPWDGNCFMSRQAWNAIRSEIAQAPENKYFIVPMARMTDNEVLIYGGEVPKAVEEPQIIFRADAAEIFNADFYYGRRPKVELLWRLAVKGPWDEYPDDPWDQQRSPVSPDADLVGRAGWVARLSSGMTTLEANSGQAPLHRGLARSGAILSTLQRLDAKLAGSDSENPVSIRPEVLLREVKNKNKPKLKPLVDTLREAADEALVAEGTSLQSAFDNSLVLALAWSFTGSVKYLEGGVELLEHLFINPETRRAPDSASEELFYYLDAVRIFERAGSIEEGAGAGLRRWLRARLQWLSTTTEGTERRRAADHRGTFYELEIASIASFLDDQKLVYDSLVRSQARIESQFSSQGRQSAEIVGLESAHRYCLNFQLWIHLAELASRWGVDLWGYVTPNGSGLGAAAQWFTSHMGKALQHGPIEGFDAERFQPIWFGFQGLGLDVERKEDDRSLVYAAKAVFDPGNAVRPFWNLGSYGPGD